MRLRSPQFVFLFLLAFAGQVREDHALRLITGPGLHAGQLRESSAYAVRHHPSASVAFAPADGEMGLRPAESASARVPWPMRRPALHSTAVMSYTGFLRA